MKLSRVETKEWTNLLLCRPQLDPSKLTLGVMDHRK